MRDLKELVKEMQEVSDRRDLTDKYLAETGRGPTREQTGMGDYAYGITFVPISWVLPHLERLMEIESREGTR